MMERWQTQEVQEKESRWLEEIPQVETAKGEDRTKMKKEAKLLRCTLLNSVEHREEVHEKVQRKM